MARLLQLPTPIPATNGVNPNLKFMQTTDSLETISTPGYLNSGNLEGYPISNQDFILISYDFIPTTGVDNKGWFTVSITGGIITLNLWTSGGGGGGVILPTQIGHVATYADTSGLLTEDPALAVIGDSLRIIGSLVIQDISPDPSACLDASNAGQNSKGIGFPQITTSNKLGISSPLEGLVVYDTDLNALCVYANGVWVTLGSGSGASVVLPTQANHVATYTNTTGTISEDPVTAIIANSLQIGADLAVSNNVTITNNLSVRGKVAVDRATADASACIDASQAGGFLRGIGLPQISTTNKLAISSPLEGLIVFDTTLHALCIYADGAWVTLGGGSGTVILPTTANHIATYVDTSGTLSEDPTTAITDGNLEVNGEILTNGGSVSGRYTAINLVQTDANDTNATAIKIGVGSFGSDYQGGIIEVTYNDSPYSSIMDFSLFPGGIDTIPVSGMATSILANGHILNYFGNQIDTSSINYFIGRLGINTPTPDASTCIDASNVGSRGIAFPQMTTSQKNGITSPLAGLMVYDTDLNALCIFSSGVWKQVVAS